MRIRNALTGLFLVVAVLTQGAVAFSRSSEGSVTVVARGTAGLRIEGKSSALSLEEDGSTLTFKVPVANIATGIDLRDRHLRETLEAEKFPAASLRVSRADLKASDDRAGVERTVKGELTLHDQSRAVDIRYRTEPGQRGITRVRGSMQIDMREFDIKSPSYFGVHVAPQVEVNVELAVEGA
jgi:polyisoprenoid-binding protein YceI